MFDKAAIFSIDSPSEFRSVSLDVFRFQFYNNPVYHKFCQYLQKTPESVTTLEEIPFLPIEFFKSHRILSSKEPVEIVFTSSGTTGQERSQHLVTDCSYYTQSFREAFHHFYGNVEDYAILALLPSYLERKGSSLIYMANDLIKTSKSLHSGFYLNDFDTLKVKLNDLERKAQKTILIGVSFALLELVEHHSFELRHTIVMETGGMKGRRKEMIRAELHDKLKTGFGVPKIHSEYGMTELLSQAYSHGDGIFNCPPWMQILIRDPEDPFTILPNGKTGGINVIDLANLNSCSFIATQDLGKNSAGGTEIMGRFDHSDIRGCNLLIL